MKLGKSDYSDRDFAAGVIYANAWMAKQLEVPSLTPVESGFKMMVSSLAKKICGDVGVEWNILDTVDGPAFLCVGAEMSIDDKALASL